jgi:hypothetical protein
MLTVTFKPFMLSFIMKNAIMLSLSSYKAIFVAVYFLNLVFHNSNLCNDSNNNINVFTSACGAIYTVKILQNKAK